MIPKIQCYIFTRKSPLLRNKNCQEIFTTNMVACLDIHNSFFLDIYIDNTADMICHIYHLHLHQYYIKQQHYRNCRPLCYH